MLITTIRKPPNQGNNCHLVRYKSQPVKNHVIQTKTHQSLDPLLETLRNSGRQSLSKVSGYEADATSWRDWSPDRTSWRVSILLSLVQTELRLRRSPGSQQSLISVSSSLVCAPSGRSEQTGSKSEPRDPESEPNMGQMGEGGGAVKWTLPLSCDIGDTPGMVTNGQYPETFSGILFWWSPPRIQNKSVKVPIIHAPLQTTSIYPHIRDLCLG